MIDASTVSFNINFLRESALDLAVSQQSAILKKGHILIKPELDKASASLKEAYRMLAKMAKNKEEMMPAAEWLIDNFYIVQEQIVQVNSDFPKEYQRNIPMLTDGYLKGWPRVYELVLNLVTYTDNLVDANTLANYIKNYQEEKTLMLGEVWAIPIMARFVLIQQLAEKSKKVLEQKKMQAEVNRLVKEVLEQGAKEPGFITHMLTQWYNSKASDYDDLVLLIELANQFQASGLLQNEQKRWFAYRFKQFDIVLEDALRAEAQKKSRLQVSIQNAVISLREVAENDWFDFVEECSIVDQMLRLDPHGCYAGMAPQTRDLYRRTIERISRQSAYTEAEVTEHALSLAEHYAGMHVSDDPDYLNDRSILKQHVGYYLLDDGYEQLTKKLDYKMPFSEKIRNMLGRNVMYYIGAIGIVTLMLICVMWLIVDLDDRSDWAVILVLLLTFFPFLDLSISAVNRFFAFFLPPRMLPRMDVNNKLLRQNRAMVVVPTLLTSPGDVVTQLEKLEIRALANPNPELQFALLSDFADADKKELPGDAAIYAQIEESITELNRKYSSEFGDKFFVLHRERQWNESEQKWMGWERKRGKIEEFNRLLCTPEAETTFIHIFGSLGESLSKKPVRFIITLDADTQLPPDSVTNIIRVAAHPLNRAWYNPVHHRITKGYGIIQPRISITPESATRTWFSKIFSGNVGLDPYSTAVSDIYQDLNGEAVFTGKGVFDVQAFHKVMENRLPENHILSHDLIESAYIRTGLATDIEFFDDYPGTYNSYTKRNSRWTRGDWQILSWLFPTVPEKNGKVPNPINRFSKWKIFDNLRRSLNPLFLCLLFITGWFWLPGAAWAWTVLGMGIIAFPVYTSLSIDIVNRPARVKWQLYFEKVRNNLWINSVQVFSTLITLPHQAAIHLDAILRTLWRLNVSKKKLLEWVTSSHVENNSTHSLLFYMRHMAVSVLLGAGLIIASATVGLNLLFTLIPFSLLWIASPYYAWFISKPLVQRRQELGKEGRRKLRLYARRTWFYFERFMTEEHNWLPPDNYQEDPPIGVAPRTSPTNIGLALVSTISAYNRGYLSFGTMLTQLENTFKTLEKLKRYKGHFYNWYETTDYRLLHPHYVSTVDSGNLVAGFIILEEALKKERQSKSFNDNVIAGLQDTLRSIAEILAELQSGKKQMPTDFSIQVNKVLDRMLTAAEHTTPRNVKEYLDLLNAVRADAAALNNFDVSPLKDDFDFRMLSHLKFWFSRPWQLVESAISEFSHLVQLEEELRQSADLNKLQQNLYKKTAPAPNVAFVQQWNSQIAYLIKKCQDYVRETDFRFLYLEKRGLFTIGFNVEKSQADSSTYDLLASEARIASYIAIAKGDVPAEHWFRLSRRLTSLDKKEILLSWGGTMFEYLMPLLFMRSFPNTLLSHTYGSIISWQRNYGMSRKNPWGFSESAYNFLNIELHYQYRAFGAPGLGLKRGLAEEYVVAPYASMLALMVEPHSAIENLEEIEQIGGKGIAGFYDAIDFTPAHLNAKEKYKVVKTYMVHHHGMSLLAIENALNNWAIHDYFHSNQQIKSCDLLLQEKIPRGVPIKEPHPIDVELEPGEQQTAEYFIDHAALHELDVSPPRGQLMSNGSYTTFVNHAGTGWSQYNDMLLTGKKSDPTTDPLGLFFYIKDLEDGTFWSATHQPVRRKPGRYDTWFHNGKVITSRVDNWIESTVAVSVSPDFPMEYRKIILTNYSSRRRKLQLTSYAEVVLNQAAGHSSHPAFSKLFIQTEYLAEHHALVARRRPRDEHEKEQWLVHAITGFDTNKLAEPIQFETDRAQFIGRGRTLEYPQAMDEGNQLSGSLGNVLDPIVSLRNVVILEPGEDMEITFTLGRAESLEEARLLANMYDTPHAIDRAFDLASVYSMVELNHIGINSRQAHYFHKLSSYLVYPNKEFRAAREILVKNKKTQMGLWPYGISGDFPLIVLRINSTEQVKNVRKLLKAHTFWRFKGFKVEFLILNDHPPSYADEVQETINQEIQKSLAGQAMNTPGGVFVLKTDKMPEEDLALILSYAYLVFNKNLPPLTDKFFPKTSSWLKDPVPENAEQAKTPAPDTDHLHLYNGFGGFNAEGDEYKIIIQPDESGNPVFPPAPWVNIVANPQFGFMASEKGAGYTWSQNSRENKLTSWSNDPVMDSHSEVFYLRDEESKHCWTPTPGPVSQKNTVYEICHGFGYTTYRHHSNNIRHELTEFVHRSEPLKFSWLKLKNTGSERRTITLARYQELVMGVERGASARFIIPEAPAPNVIFARNSYNAEFAGRAAFTMLTASGLGEQPHISYTTDRESFIGRNRSLGEPAALSNPAHLNNDIIIGADVCVAFKTCVEIEPGQEIELLVLTGETATKKEAAELINTYAKTGEAAAELQKVKSYWKEMLGKIEVHTPDNTMNIMLNGWLMYQNVASRQFARSAFYQAGGAFGFRDQLQDSMAYLYADPAMTRAQILLHAERQFPEGDVLHWWHPPTGRGIRSRITDDRLWLPFVTHFYIQSTGDSSILDEKMPYITSRLLEDHEHEVYLIPDVSDKKESLYKHCCRAIDISLQFGKHQLPLIGAGDWNDGMNRVGKDGKGESVWLGFFLYDVLHKFIPICREQQDEERVRRYSEVLQNLEIHLNQEGWDGEWYLRAFYDDGTPLGSSENDECKIDAISQAWSVLTNVAPADRAEQVLQALDQHLIDEQARIIRLLTPAFDQTPKNPGYIKGYIPGVRENGGQYTHAALWVVMAFAKAGYGNKAMQLFHMINPINHARDREGVSVYKVEPYVMAADVYGSYPLTGRGGWSWYTGSAGWMYRAGLEAILGFRLNEKGAELAPVITSVWGAFSITVKPDDTTEYHIEVKNPDGLQTGILENVHNSELVEKDEGRTQILFKKDGQKHHIKLILTAGG